MSKAADILHCSLMTASILIRRFAVQQHAFQFLNVSDLNSVCRYLSNQKQSAEEAFWQHLDTGVHIASRTVAFALAVCV